MLLTVMTLSAQVKTVPYSGPEPEFIGETIVINWDGTAYPAEKLIAELDASTPFFEYRNLSISVNGAKSPVRVKQGPVRLVVRAANQSVDPMTEVVIIQLYGKKNRNTKVAYYKDHDSIILFDRITRIPYLAKRYGDNSYLLTVDYLEPGEYAVISGPIDPKKTNLVMAFGVD